MPKFTNAERELIKSIVASLTIKRIPDSDIIDEVFNQTNKRIKIRYLSYVKQAIEKESYQWYKAMRQSQYSYVHEFKERISEIYDLQKRHHKIIDSEVYNIAVKQKSLEELHRLNITLSNYFAVAPTIVNDFTIPAITTEDKTTPSTATRNEFIV